MYEQIGHGRFRDLRLDERETSSRAQTENRRTCQSRQGRKEPRKVGPPDTTVSMRGDGTTVQMRRACKVAERGINGDYEMVKKYRDRN